MADVIVVTGGGSGMGLEVAKIVGKDAVVVISGRTMAKLEDAVAELTNAGVDARPFVCDVSDRASVQALADYATEIGTVKKVIHAAGVSPHMADASKIFAINAGGTINVDDVFGPIIADNGVILNTSSMAAYMVPESSVPVQIYQASAAGVETFLAACDQMLEAIPEEQRRGSAYSISKNFVIWYTKRKAVELGKRGVRVVSISPGTFETPMGEIEGEQAAQFAKSGALGRLGQPIEIARVMAFMVSDDASYLTGSDILYDGGTIAALQVRADAQQG